MPTPLRRLALVGALVAAGAPAAAGPPYVTDDPEPTAPGHWEFYFAVAGVRDRAGWAVLAPLVDGNFGALRDLQLHVSTPFVLAAPGGEAVTWGYGDTEVGAKYRFLSERGRRPQMSFYPLVTIPTGGERGVGTATVFLPLWLMKTRGAWTTYGGAGAGLIGDHGWAFVGWQLQRSFGGHTAVGAELFYVSPRVLRESHELRFNVGAVVDVNEHHHVLVSAGRAIVGTTLIQGYLGYLFTFGPGPAEQTVPH
jgi:hypothetical protein